MLNKVQLIGNLGDDPQVRITDGGKAIATFSLATNRRWKDREGNPQEATEWHRIVCWGRRAKIAEEFLTKGRQVYVEGRLQTTSWEDEEAGITRYRTEIVCQNLQMLARPNGGSAAGSGEQPPGADEPQAGASSELADEDIPF
jgi:single-strand DNA-binding protein